MAGVDVLNQEGIKVVGKFRQVRESTFTTRDGEIVPKGTLFVDIGELYPVKVECSGADRVKELKAAFATVAEFDAVTVLCNQGKWGLLFGAVAQGH